jgi:tripartite ATP-independent transporter DctM subunit
MGQFILLAVPLYLFMAFILERAGVAEDLYDMMYLWFGPVRGGLAVGTIIICTIFAAMSGITGTATVTMAAIALPSMLKRGYDKSLAIGCINSGAGWGILMPPSVDMIIYALIAQESVGKMFAGGVLPTILLLILDTIYILTRSYFQPKIAPALPKDKRADWPTKFRSLKALVLPMLVIVAVLGCILLGITTPTEAAAIGVFGALASAYVNRKLSWAMVKEAAIRTLNITGMVMWIIFGAGVFSSFLQGVGASQVIIDLMKYIPAGRWGTFIFFQIIIFILAMLMNSTTIMMLTIPIFVPVIKALGFDPLWYGVLFIVQMEVGCMTPPFGYNLFYIKSVVSTSNDRFLKDITMADIYRSVIFFTICEMTGFVIMCIFPEIILLLPNMLFR